MPLTVITLTKVPPSLRGDLTKWLQEISTGVYVGNINTRIREQLWERVKESAKNGEVTLTYACRNELGYDFDMINGNRSVVDSDGIPLVCIPNREGSQNIERESGFSDAAKFRRAQKFAYRKKEESTSPKSYVVLDIETDGLDEKKNKIIEIGIVKVDGKNIETFHSLVAYKGILPPKITSLTGIQTEDLKAEGRDLQRILQEVVNFIGNHDIVGYNIDFDIRFINYNLKKIGQDKIRNKTFDLKEYVKREKMFLKNYKLQTALEAYGIEKEVPHRALEDAKLTGALALKVKKFTETRK